MKKGILLRIGAAVCFFLLGFEGGRRLPLRGASEPAALSGSEKSEELPEPDQHTSVPIDAIPTDEIAAEYGKLYSYPKRGIESARNLKALARRWILESPSSIFDSPHRFQLLSEWARMDPHSLLKALREANDDDAFREACYTLSATAPETLLLFLEQQPDLWGISKDDVPRAIRELAKRDPELAAEFLERLQVSPDATASDRFQIGNTTMGSGSQNIYGAVAVEMSRLDLESAVQWAKSLSSLELQERALESILADLAIRSPEEARALYQDVSASTGVDLFGIVRLAFGNEPVEGLLWAVKQGTPSLAGSLLTNYSTELHDIHDIRQVYDRLDNPSLQHRFASHLLMNWHERSAEGGLDLVLSFPEENQSFWIKQLGFGIGGASFDTGWELAASIPDPELRETFEKSLIRSLAEGDLERAIALAEEAEDPVLLQETLEWGYYVNAEEPAYSFEEVESWLGQIEGSSYHSDVSTALMERRFDADPEETLAWFETLKETTRQSVVYGLARRLKELDTERAVEWASNLPTQEERFAAIPAVLDSLAYGSPPKAFQLARKLDHSQLRMKEMQHAMAIWAKRDPDEAWKALHSSSTLTAKEIERLSVLFYGKR